MNIEIQSPAKVRRTRLPAWKCRGVFIWKYFSALTKHKPPTRRMDSDLNLEPLTVSMSWGKNVSLPVA